MVLLHKPMCKQTEIGLIPEDWEVKTIGDVFTLSQGLQIAKNQRRSVQTEGAVPLLKITELPSGKFAEFVKGIQPQHLASKDDLIYTRTGQVGLVYTDFEGCVHNNCFKIHYDTKKFDKMFVYYLLQQQRVYDYANSVAGGSVQKDLSHPAFKSCIIAFPSLSEQKKIGKILADLDAKIKLNRELNKILESVGQAVFKRWFVDFEFPNEEGKPYKSSGGEIVHSEEIGKEIPKEWKVSTLEEIAFNFDSKRVPLSSREREKMQGNYPYYGAAGILDHVDNFIFDGTYVLMGEDGTVIDENGFPVLQLVRGKFWVNNHAHVLQGKGISTELLFLLLKNTNVEHIVTGAVQPKINQGNMNTLKFVIPDEACKKRLQKFVNQLYTKIGENEKQSQILAQIRDLLLPKLMSGKIRVPIQKEDLEAQ